MTPAAGIGLVHVLSRSGQEVAAALDRLLPSEGSEPRELVAAMRYSVLAGGKRLRPVLFLLTHDGCCQGEPPVSAREELAEAAAALELFHTYSLIHDDLPCMDDDSLRRGKPTCHVVYGEAMALLSGDALQTLGFEVLATRPRGEDAASRRAEAVRLAAEAIGFLGMAGGQALDLASTGGAASGPRTAERLWEIHAKKTGCLIRAAAELGALHAGAGLRTRAAVARYGEAIGLLFQIADDLLDVTSNAQTLGKTAGKDDAQEKLTYPAVFGLEGAYRERDRALEAARDAARDVARDVGTNGELLADLADTIARRDR